MVLFCKTHIVNVTFLRKKVQAAKMIIMRKNLKKIRLKRKKVKVVKNQTPKMTLTIVLKVVQTTIVVTLKKLRKKRKEKNQKKKLKKKKQKIQNHK